jgi:hypothetical protein
MRKFLLITLILTLTADMADARRRGHHRGHRFEPYAIERSDRDAIESIGRRSIERQDNGRRGTPLLALVPADWQLQPPDPNWQGRRYVAPEGDAWLALYASSTGGEPLDQHWKAVAFGEGEELTLLQRERDWLVVSGFKGDKADRIFYRKAVLACGERSWRHVAFEYPAEAKRVYDRLVTRVAHALDLAVDRDCDEVTGRN